jgi:hypothetical protein
MATFLTGDVPHTTLPLSSTTSLQGRTRNDTRTQASVSISKSSNIMITPKEKAHLPVASSLAL